jgi:hypothetical protein
MMADKGMAVSWPMAQAISDYYRSLRTDCPICGTKTGSFDPVALCDVHDATHDVVPVHRRNEYGVQTDVIGWLVVAKV